MKLTLLVAINHELQCAMKVFLIKYLLPKLEPKGKILLSLLTSIMAIVIQNELNSMIFLKILWPRH